MILFINTSQTNLIQLKLIDKGKIVRQLENREEYRQSELLLSMIDKLLKKQKSKKPARHGYAKGVAGGAKKQRIKKIAVVSGPGAFSALRLGVATANALAWSLKVPLIELNVDEVQNNDELIESINQRSKEPARHGYAKGVAGGAKKQKFIPVVPKYGKEPNITKSINPAYALPFGKLRVGLRRAGKKSINQLNN